MLIKLTENLVNFCPKCNNQVVVQKWLPLIEGSRDIDFTTDEKWMGFCGCSDIYFFKKWRQPNNHKKLPPINHHYSNKG